MHSPRTTSHSTVTRFAIAGALLLAACGSAPEHDAEVATTAEALSPVSARPYRPIAGGQFFMCELGMSGAVYCHGENGSGQLGNSTFSDAHSPVAVAGLTNQTYLAAGTAHVCSLGVDGRVSCWGQNSYGQLGNGTTTNTSSPTTVVLGGGIFSMILGNVTAIAASQQHTCALLANGTVRCWGGNGYAQLGNGNTTNQPYPVAVSGLSSVVAISAGIGHTCALRSDGTVWCWGNNSFGQLGTGAPLERPALTPQLVPSLSNVTAISSTYWGNCALLANGTMRCWGYGGDGELGNGTTTLDQATPVNAAIANVTSIASGGWHNCAIVGSGASYCWGYNYYGQLGNGATGNSSWPVPVGAAANPSAYIGASGFSTCSKTADGNLWCFGRDENGELGDGKSTDSANPVYNLVPQYIGSGALAGLRFYTSCAVSPVLGRVACWGENLGGELGDGTTDNRATPALIAGLRNVTRIAPGLDHVCALVGGSVSCWGRSMFGLGDGAHTQSATPVTVSGIATATAIGSGSHFSCAVLADGTVRCWGDNSVAELGDGTLTARSTPVVVRGVSNVTALSVGESHSCAVTQGGSVWCWGANYSGQIGNGTTVNAPLAVAVPGIHDAVAVAAGGRHTCARRATGGVMCWGDNANGELGDGTTTPRLLPVALTIGNVAALAAGSRHTCAVFSDGSARCWGAGGNGALGNGTTADRLWPTPVTGLSGAVEIVAGDQTTCAAFADGSMSCWGYNFAGELGNGTVTDSAVPVRVSSW